MKQIGESHQIVQDPLRRFGKPTIGGTRIDAMMLAQQIKGGYNGSIDDYLNDWGYDPGEMPKARANAELALEWITAGPRPIPRIRMFRATREKLGLIPGDIHEGFIVCLEFFRFDEPEDTRIQVLYERKL